MIMSGHRRVLPFGARLLTKYDQCGCSFGNIRRCPESLQKRGKGFVSFSRRSAVCDRSFGDEDLR